MIHDTPSQNHRRVSLNQDMHANLPANWILLDNQSMVDIFHNAALLHKIHHYTARMEIHCNVGVATTDLIGDLPGYGTIWYHLKCLANILSL